MKTRREKKIKACLVTAVLLTALLLFTGCGRPDYAVGDPPEQLPVIFYQGNTVALPGDIVTISGEYLDSITSVEVEGKEVPMIQAGIQSFKFEIPKNLKEGAFTCVFRGEGVYETVVINQPKAVWVQGDEGSIATPGGWLRVNGECLSLDSKKVSVELVDENGKKKSLSAQAMDAYSARVELPEDLAKGTYTARYSNGYAWSKAFEVTVASSPRDSWPTEVFNILDYGAKPNVWDFDNTPAVQAALWDISDNGGGVLYFPKGFYHMAGGEMTVPKNTVLRGEGMDMVSVYWGRAHYVDPPTVNEWTAAEMPSCLFSAVGGNVAFEEITFAGAMMPSFLDTGSVGGPLGCTENIYINHCRIWANLDSYNGRVTGEDAEIYSKKVPPMIQSRCDNLQITDCDLQWHVEILSGGVAGSEARNALVSGNRIERAYTLVNVADYRGEGIRQITWNHAVSNNTIFENNEIIGFTTSILGENCYFGNNDMHDKHDGDREGMTSDWGNGIEYCGAVTIEDDFHVVFPEESGVGSLRTEAEVCGTRYAVLILEGAGAGQYRYVTEREGCRLTVEEPFEAWDETSVFTLARLSVNWYVVGNKATDVGSLQMYCPQANTVFAGNETYYADGMISEGFRVYGAYSVKWYISFVENKMRAGVYYGKGGAFGPNDIYQTRMRLTALTEVRIAISSLVRRNEFYDLSNLRLYHIGPVTNGSDVVIEDNYFKNALVGINFYGSCYNGTVLAGNRFEDCDENISYPAETECFIEID